MIGKVSTVKKRALNAEVAVIGQGYVGLSLAMAVVSVGIPVIGVDSSKGIVNQLNNGLSHIEGVPNQTLQLAIDSGIYQATDDFSQIAGCNVVVIAVPTPIDEMHKPDLGKLKRACDAIAPHVSPLTLIISESTSYIGTLRNLVANRISELNKSQFDFAVSPERVDPGNATFDVKNTARIVGGLTHSATQKAVDFYRKFCGRVIAVSSAEVAEASKLLENTYRYVNIAFINEFSQLMNTMKIPATEVIEAAATKPFGFAQFIPSAGVGGHCIAVDPFYLQKSAIENCQPLNFVELSKEINGQMAKYLVSRLEEKSGPILGKSVLVIGLSYKPNVADARESASFNVIEELRLKGALVSWHDPIIKSHGGSTSSSISDDYDLALVLVNHEILDFSDWGDSPIFCINKDRTKPTWIPLIGT